MATFEEEVVKFYYNQRNYFTIENIAFPAAEKRKGGKGRGEIDLVAIKIDRNSGKVVEAVCIEVSASVTEHFPFISEQENADDVKKIIRKFFESDVDEKLKELYSGDYKFKFITSEFRKDENLENLLSDKLKQLGANVIEIRRETPSILVKIEYKGKIKEIEITPFTHILNQLIELNKNNTKYSPNKILRVVQWINLILKKKEEVEN